MTEVMEGLTDSGKKSVCNKRKSCGECRSIPHCNWCPIEGKNQCGNDNVFIDTPCHLPAQCVGPKCGQQSCPTMEPAG